MKMQLSIIIGIIFTSFCFAQAEQVETKSVTLENLISFIADNYPSQTNNEISEDDIIPQNITFLLETNQSGISAEDKTILKQAFKFLSKRLTEKDRLSIIFYSGINGLLIEGSSPKDLKKIYHAINKSKLNLIGFCKDGITMAYEKIEDNEGLNTVLMVRNPNASGEAVTYSEETPKKNSNVVLLTAIGLLPEIISLIK